MQGLFYIKHKVPAFKFNKNSEIVRNKNIEKLYLTFSP